MTPATKKHKRDIRRAQEHKKYLDHVNDPAVKKQTMQMLTALLQNQQNAFPQK